MPIPARGVAAIAPADTFRIVIVCTGNICRSPAAEILARHLLVGRLGGRAAARIALSSAGTRAVVGAAVHPLTRASLAPWQLDGELSGGFRARQLDGSVVDGADLVLGVDPGHRSAVLERFPHLLDRTFALRELARLISAAASDAAGPDIVERGRALVGSALRRRGTIPPADDRVPDPVLGGDEAHRASVMMVFEALRSIVDGLAPRGIPAGEPRGSVGAVAAENRTHRFPEDQQI